MKYGELTLGQIEAIVNKLGGMTGVMQLLTDEVIVNKKTTSQPLKFITSVTVPSVKQFAAVDHFKHGEIVERVKCYLWSNFSRHFGGKIEEDMEECVIRVHELLKSSRDLGIRSEIGEEREETKLAHLWHLLTLQPNGEKGTLLTNGYANIFYIRGTENILWAVVAYWYGDEWNLCAVSVGSLDEWLGGIRVCSR